MQNVDIYIKTTARGPSIRPRAMYIYVIKIDITGREYTRTGTGLLEDVTENQITLQAIIHALMRFNRSCDIRIFTECEHVLNSCRNFWPQQWEKNGWIKNNGKEVKNADLWQQYLNLTKDHAISFSDDKHEYSNWMESELERMEKNGYYKNH